MFANEFLNSIIDIVERLAMPPPPPSSIATPSTPKIAELIIDPRAYEPLYGGGWQGKNTP